MSILITSFLTITTFTEILTIKQDWSDVMLGESSILQRPKDTPFEKEIFHLLVKQLIRPILFRFTTKTFISYRSHGNLCLDTLKDLQSLCLTLRTVYISIVSFLLDPTLTLNSKSKLDSSCGPPQTYEKAVCEWTVQYTSSKWPPHSASRDKISRYTFRTFSQKNNKQHSWKNALQLRNPLIRLLLFSSLAIFPCPVFFFDLPLFPCCGYALNSFSLISLLFTVNVSFFFTVDAKIMWFYDLEASK